MSIQTNYRNKINVGQQKSEVQDRKGKEKRNVGQFIAEQKKCRTKKDKRNVGQIIAEQKKCRTKKGKKNEMQDKLSQNERSVGQIKFGTNYCRKDDGNTKIKSVLYILKKFTPNTKNKSKFYKNPFLKLFLLSPD